MAEPVTELEVTLTCCRRFGPAGVPGLSGMLKLVFAVLAFKMQRLSTREAASEILIRSRLTIDNTVNDTSCAGLPGHRA